MVGITRASFPIIFDMSKIFEKRSCSKPLGKRSRISRVGVGSVEKRSCRDLPRSGLKYLPKYLPTRTRSARPKFDHYPMLTRSTGFLLESRSRSSRSPYDRIRSLPDPYPIPFDLTRSLPDRTRSILEHTRSLPYFAQSRAMSFNRFLQKARRYYIRLSLVARRLKTEVETDAANR